MKRRIYVGWDERDDLAFRACVASLQEHSSVKLDIIPIKDHELRRKGVYWRSYHVEPNGQKVDDRDGKPFSTGFSFGRFAIPLIDDSDDWVLFCDADMLFMDDVENLFQLADDNYDLMVVQHDYRPKQDKKFDGFLQQHYNRKNWSSVMLMRPCNINITRYVLNSQTGSFLHGLYFCPDDRIGALPEEWNWLEGWSSLEIQAKNVHYTRGTPDMIGNDIIFADEWWQAVNKWQPGMNRESLPA